MFIVMGAAILRSLRSKPISLTTLQRDEMCLFRLIFYSLLHESKCHFIVQQKLALHESICGSCADVYGSYNVPHTFRLGTKGLKVRIIRFSITIF